jgi:hypothetical protein
MELLFLMPCPPGAICNPQAGLRANHRRVADPTGWNYTKQIANVKTNQTIFSHPASLFNYAGQADYTDLH